MIRVEFLSRGSPADRLFDGFVMCVCVCVFCFFLALQSSKGEYKLWKWSATAKYYTSHTKPCYQRGSLCQDPAGNWTTRRPPDNHKEMQTAMVWSCLPFIRSGQNHLASHSERGKKTRQTEEEVGRQDQGKEGLESQRAVENSEK